MNQTLRFYLTLTYGRRLWGNDEGMFQRGDAPFHIINPLISTPEPDHVTVTQLMDLFSSAPQFNVFVCKGPGRETAEERISFALGWCPGSSRTLQQLLVL